MFDRFYCVYILSSQRNGTLYIGIIDNLVRRVWEHKNKKVDGFTKKYEIHNLVYFEQHNNPTWKDLYQDIL